MKPYYLLVPFFFIALSGCVVVPQPAPVSQYGCQQTPSPMADRGPSITCPQPNGAWLAANAPPSVGAIAQPPAPTQVIVQPPPVIVAPPAYAYPVYGGYYGGGWGGYYGGW